MTQESEMIEAVGVQGLAQGHMIGIEPFSCSRVSLTTT